METLDSLASELRHLFILRKRVSKRNYNLPEAQFKKEFLKAAELCQTLQAEPMDFINSQFHNSDNDRLIPAFLASSISVKKYRTYMEYYGVDLEEYLNVCLMMLERQLSLGRPIEWVLMSPDFQFPAWFRLCITEEPIPEIIKAYGAKAKQEFSGKLRDFLISKGLDYLRILK